MSIPCLAVPRKQQLGLVLLVMSTDPNTKPDTQKELVCYSLNDSANKTYCEPPRQGEIIQPLLNWSEHSPPRRLYGGARIVQENSLESVEPGTEGKWLKSQSYSLYDPRGLRWGSLGGSAVISFLFVPPLLHRMIWILLFILTWSPCIVVHACNPSV